MYEIIVIRACLRMLFRESSVQRNLTWWRKGVSRVLDE